MIISPTVGRVVWYRPSGHDVLQLNGMYQVDGVQPFVAHVTYVWSDFMVNLVVYDHAGSMFIRTSVPLKQEGDDVPMMADGAPYCEWMPYQVGQAKKHAEPMTSVPVVGTVS
jgi:hypothetical protein